MAQAFHHRASPRLGRVRGEYRRKMHVLQQILQRFRRDALLAQLGDSALERAQPEWAALRHFATPITVRKSFFGDVDQTEIRGERTDHLFQLIRRHGLDQIDQGFA